MRPIITFESEKEMIDCLSEWQKRLFLNDWCIGIRFAHQCDMEELGRAGESEVNWVNMDGTITILYPQDMPDVLHYYSQEEVLIHELLHFKYMGFFQNGSSTIEGVYYDVMQHQLLEQMAKSLFIAKYNLPSDWFNQENECNVVEELKKEHEMIKKYIPKWGMRYSKDYSEV